MRRQNFAHGFLHKKAPPERGLEPYTLAHAINSGPTYAIVNKISFPSLRKKPPQGWATKDTGNFTPIRNTPPQA